MPLRREPRALVERDRALMSAQLATRRAWAGGVQDMEGWATAEFDPEALVLYDLHGEPLFYEFTARDGAREVGRVKASASRLVGSPVVTIEHDERRWDPAGAIEMVTDAARKTFPRREVTPGDFVCYSYPKVGLRVEIAGEPGENAIFDVADGTQIQQFGSDAPEGQAAWSFLESIPASEIEGNLSRFEQSDRDLEEVRAASPEVFAAAFSPRELARLRAELILPSDHIMIPFYSQKTLVYAPRCTPHACFALYAQETNVYCAVATGQMILDFYRYNFSQPAIAAAMGTDAGGTSFSGQETGYKTLSNGGLDAAHDFTADWTEAKAEIDANRPVKSGISGHARACAGWKRRNITLIGLPPERWLQIYDPWPWNANLCAGGAVYWENWDAVTHTNFCYVRHT